MNYNTDFRLQLRHGAKEGFATRDEVIGYIDGTMKFGQAGDDELLVPYEPILFFYGKADESGNTDKKCIILVGLPKDMEYDGKPYFLIDTADLEEKIEKEDSRHTAIEEKIEQEIEDRKQAVADEAKAREEADEKLENEIQAEADARSKRDDELTNAIHKNNEDIQSIVDACGLVYNEKLSEDRVSYEPDNKDDVIRDAKNISEAIELISKYAAKIAKDLKISVKSTDTVTFTKETDSENGGSVIKADVNIAGSEGLSKKNFDNNIIGKRSDGIYAAASLELSKDKPNTLVFSTSGYKDGEFKVDAYETEVPLSQYNGDDGNSTGVKVAVDKKNTIYAKLNLASEDSNMLKLVDGEYSVEGRAKNIIYKDSTVFNALNSQEKEIEDIKNKIDFVENVDVKGSTTDTTIVKVGHDEKKGYFTVSSDVKLSDDKSIRIENGGLSANVSASYSSGSSTLSINVGTNKYDIDLSELAVSVLKGATYDSTTEEIVLTFIVGDKEKTLRIPVATLIHDMEADDTNSIHLDIKSVIGGPNRISGELKVDSTHSDNMLTVTSSGAYVSKSYITDAVEKEADIRKASDAELKSAIENVSDLANANKVAIKENATAIAQEAKDARAAEKTNADAIEANKTAIKANESAINSEIARAKEAEENNADAIVAEASRAKEAEAKNANYIVSEINRATEKENDILAKVNENAVAIAQNTTAIANEATTARSAEKANADALTEEVSRAKAAEAANSNAIVKETDRAIEKETNILEKVTKNTSDIESITTTVGEIELRKEGELDYALYVSGTKHGEFSIPKDQFLKSVKYDETSKKLIFVFSTTSGEVTSEVSIADLVDTYTNGEGLKLSDNVFSVDFTKVASVDTLSYSVLVETNRAEAAENEIKTVSDANAVAVKENASAIAAEEKRATSAETELFAQVYAENSRATKAEGELGTSISTLNGKIETETGIARNAEKALSDKIDTVSTKVDTAKADLTTLINENKTSINTVKSDLTGEIAKKANSTDVFTKNEITEKLGEYTKTTDMNTLLSAKANVTDVENVYATKEALQTVKDESATVESVSELETNLSERINANVTSIDNFGLTYNAATSTLTYTNKNGSSVDYKLYSGTLVERGYFDEKGNNIVLVVKNGEVESEITIPVETLLSDVSEKIEANTNAIASVKEDVAKLSKDWTVSSTPSVELSKTTSGEKDSLSASVKVASSNKQAIQTTDNGLYVSNDLEDYTVVYGATGTIDAQNAISRLLESTTAATEKIALMVEDIKKNASDIQSVATDVNILKPEVSTLKEKVANDESLIATIDSNVKTIDTNLKSVTDRVTTAEKEITTAQSDIKDVDDKVTNVETKVDTYSEKVTTIETSVKTIENNIGQVDIQGISDAIDTIKNDLIGDKDNPKEGTIWYVINNLIDVGKY